MGEEGRETGGREPSRATDDVIDASEAEGQQRRLEALHALAQQQLQSRPSAGVTAPAAGVQQAQATGSARLARRRGLSTRRVPLRAGLVALAVCVVVAGAFAWLRRPASPSTPAAPDIVTYSYVSGGILCPQDVAWSPDGSTVAVVGYAGRNCAPGAVVFGGPSNGMLEIRDGATGQVERSAALDAAVLPMTVPADIQQDPRLLRQIGIGYGSLAWSPDGKRIMLSAGASRMVLVSDPNGGAHSQITQYGSAFVFVDPANGRVQVQPVASLPDRPASSQPLSSFAAQPSVEFDTAANAKKWITVPPALAYAWDANDTLVPTQPLPPTASVPAPTIAPGPVGNPNGGSHFTMWQEGFISYAKQCTVVNGQPSVPATLSPSDVYELTLHTATWSPDGRYLVAGVGAFGRLNIPPPLTATPDPSQPQAGGSCGSTGDPSQLAPMPMRDAAMSAAVTLLDPFGQGAVTLDWSPDGRRLAAASADAAVTKPRFSIYDTATGKALWQMPAGTFGTRTNSSQQLLFQMHWSPDGKRLLLLEQQGQTIYVLGPNVVHA
jgi:Tol biopolymer transport system component